METEAEIEVGADEDDAGACVEVEEEDAAGVETKAERGAGAGEDNAAVCIEVEEEGKAGGG